MSVEVRTFNVTVPAGTAIATPQVTALDMPARVVRWIEVQVPPGPSGLVGFRITAGRTQVVPVNVGAWLISDDHRFHWDLSQMITSGAWQLTAYNTGTYDHLLSVDFGVDPPQLVSTSASPALIPSGSLSGTVDLPN